LSGFAALSKNEGLALLVALSIALVITTRKLSVPVRLWPAFVIAGLWQAARLMHHLDNDLFEGKAARRFVDKLADFPAVLRALASHPPDRGLLWIAILLTLVIFARDVWRRERLLFTAIFIQLMFYVASYVLTPHDVGWHVANSWVRIMDQMSLPLVVLSSLILMFRLRTKQTNPEVIS
jgi:hypothetical protein